ncbi:hypothetical protein PRIPAC_93685 [Pristionchus pacificus]|uniref:Uncharacterized protein n=1 Tax=Pristionchus pacificus TaxID=54126 RepID=A0A2A6BBU0_PRIPA|nr:hypothetical protein PRIPAC_93685 [Pristionchus pacificus]|eukprot:PDM63311.1 hypothetical protein PRIPAC_50526 [Pristionchus pacificus]
MKVAVISAVLVAAVAANAISGMYGAINTKITVEMANQFKGIFDRFADCFTPPITALVKKLTEADLNAFVDVHNKMISGEIPAPATRDEGLALFKQYVPSIYDDLVAANKDFEDRLSKLTPEDKQRIYDMESGYFGVLKTRTQEGLVDYYLGVCKNYQGLSAASHDDFKAAFPETVSCLDEDLYKQMCAAAEQLKASNYKMDTKTMSLVGAIFQNKRFAKQN